MKKYLIFILLIWIQLTFAGITANQVTLSDTLIEYGSVETGLTYIQTVNIINDSPQPLTILKAEFGKDNFYADVVNSEIAAHNSVQINIEFETDQNIDYVDFLRIQIDGLSYPLIARVEAHAEYPETYYDLTQNKTDEELKSVLQGIIDDHTSLGYTIARDYMYGSVDNADGFVECVYTGRSAEFDTREGANANSINCEHTWPQSFFSENEPMRSDLFHLYPTDVDANSQRGNLDFGDVISSTWSEGGSALGTDASGQTVFEPREAHKGNVARTYFYFTVRYGGLYNDFEDPVKMESLFRSWHVIDQVNTAELQRNESIYTLQNNRNPFIDHPEFADRIHNFTGTSNPVYQPEIDVAPEKVNLPLVYAGETVNIKLAVINSGNSSLNISSIQSGNSDFTLSVSSLTIANETYNYLHMQYIAPVFETTDSTIISIHSDDTDEPLVEIPVKIHVVEPSGMSENSYLPVSTQLLQNYPNPFNPSTTISYTIGAQNIVPQRVELSIYNILGQKVTTLVSDYKQPGQYFVNWNAGQMASGIYYYRMQTVKFHIIHRMILIK